MPTPWGRHVNEGVPEWPPSPYRLLRGLFDVWQRKCADLKSDDVQEVLEALARTAPRFYLPEAVATHTRSYLSSNAQDPSDKNLVFDPFLVFDRASSCYVSWTELDLAPRARGTLRRLLSGLNYLGRSESWVDAELWDGPVHLDFNCSVASGKGTSRDVLRVACAIPVSEYEGNSKWIDALTYSTHDLLKERASSPPLLRQIDYEHADNAIETDPPYRIERQQSRIQEVMLGLDSTVLPLITTALEVAEQIRTRLMGAHKRVMQDESRVSPLFSGKTADGGRRLDHGHVYILPLGNSEGRIDRVLIVSPIARFAQTNWMLCGG